MTIEYDHAEHKSITEALSHFEVGTDDSDKVRDLLSSPEITITESSGHTKSILGDHSSDCSDSQTPHDENSVERFRRLIQSDHTISKIPIEVDTISRFRKLINSDKSRQPNHETFAYDFQTFDKNEVGQIPEIESEEEKIFQMRKILQYYGSLSPTPDSEPSIITRQLDHLKAKLMPLIQRLFGSRLNTRDRQPITDPAKDSQSNVHLHSHIDPQKDIRVRIRKKYKPGKLLYLARLAGDHRIHIPPISEALQSSYPDDIPIQPTSVVELVAPLPDVSMVYGAEDTSVLDAYSAPRDPGEPRPTDSSPSQTLVSQKLEPRKNEPLILPTIHKLEESSDLHVLAIEKDNADSAIRVMLENAVRTVAPDHNFTHPRAALILKIAMENVLEYQKNPRSDLVHHSAILLDILFRRREKGDRSLDNIMIKFSEARKRRDLKAQLVFAEDLFSHGVKHRDKHRDNLSFFGEYISLEQLFEYWVNNLNSAGWYDLQPSFPSDELSTIVYNRLKYSLRENSELQYLTGNIQNFPITSDKFISLDDFIKSNTEVIALITEAYRLSRNLLPLYKFQPHDIANIREIFVRWFYQPAKYPLMKVIHEYQER